MRAPAFWWLDEPTVLARLLAPAGALYGRLTERRMAQPGWRAPIPVVCVGNFTVGGAGKTPAAIGIARLLLRMGERPAFLSRGYGSAAARAGAPIHVDPAHHSAGDVGDEPLLLARVAPVFVTPDRAAAAQAAQAAGATILVMDDGLQNPSLVKDIALAIVDAGVGIGNGFCLPAGPLRAPLMAQLRHVNALIIVGDGAAGRRVAARAAGKPAFEAALAPPRDALAAYAGRPVVAFAGIGRPQKFFATLQALGADLVAAEAFADHHRFSESEIARLRRQAAASGAALVTTEKDFVRLPRLEDDSLPFPQALPVTLSLRDEAGFSAFLQASLAAARQALKASP